MALFHVKARQGRKTYTYQIEAKSAAAVRSFIEELTTLQIAGIYEVVFESTDDTPPVDDFQYWEHFKFVAANDSDACSVVYCVHNLKLTKNENDIIAAAKSFLEVDGSPVSALRTLLIRS